LVYEIHDACASSGRSLELKPLVDGRMLPLHVHVPTLEILPLLLLAAGTATATAEQLMAVTGAN
jgi:hypothetical protein